MHINNVAKGRLQLTSRIITSVLTSHAIQEQLVLTSAQSPNPNWEVSVMAQEPTDMHGQPVLKVLTRKGTGLDIYVSMYAYVLVGLLELSPELLKCYLLG